MTSSLEELISLINADLIRIDSLGQYFLGPSKDWHVKLTLEPNSKTKRIIQAFSKGPTPYQALLNGWRDIQWQRANPPKIKTKSQDLYELMQLTPTSRNSTDFDI